VCCLACVALLGMAGCSGGTSGARTIAGSSNASGTVGANMAGVQMEVHISQQALNTMPGARVLTTPESAARSYLAWTSYAYRIAQSVVATPTMGADEAVRIDSYIQYNLEKKRLLDQSLQSITFRKPSIEGTRTLVPTKEKWTYRYISIDAGNKVLGGPYSASYDATYTIVKTARGWVVDSAKAKSVGEIK
jgi:hypothetical protein